MRLIDADALHLGKFVEPRTEWHQGWNDALDAATTQAQTIDAVEVVKCKDCKHCDFREFRETVCWRRNNVVCFERHLKEDILKYGGRQAIHMAIAALREKPRWISVEERLPEDWLRVQVYRSANRTMDIDFRTPSRKGGWCHYNDVTHWMPLPEPPEVEV